MKNAALVLAALTCLAPAAGAQVIAFDTAIDPAAQLRRLRQEGRLKEAAPVPQKTADVSPTSKEERSAITQQDQERMASIVEKIGHDQAVTQADLDWANQMMDAILKPENLAKVRAQAQAAVEAQAKEWNAQLAALRERFKDADAEKKAKVEAYIQANTIAPEQIQAVAAATYNQLVQAQQALKALLKTAKVAN